MATVFTDLDRSYDLVKMELDQRYTRTSGTIKNVTGGTIAAGAIKVGTPLNLNSTQWETIDKTGESAADGIVVDQRLIPSLANNGITTLEYEILCRGPALINLDAIADDPDGSTGAYVTADLKTRLAALNPPIMTMLEPTTTETQTT